MTAPPPPPPPPPPTPDYEAPPAQAAPVRRSVGTWVTLLLVWSIGLIMWALYGIALLYLASRIL